MLDSCAYGIVLSLLDMQLGMAKMPTLAVKQGFCKHLMRLILFCLSKLGTLVFSSSKNVTESSFATGSVLPTFCHYG